MRYQFKNDFRNFLLDELGIILADEVSAGNVSINQIGKIPVDVFKKDEKCKIIFYVRKINGSFDNNKYFQDKTFATGSFVIGARSCSDNTNLNEAKTEDLIFKVWLHFKNYEKCGLLIEAETQHALISEDFIERSFFEFNVNVRNR